MSQHGAWRIVVALVGTLWVVGCQKDEGKRARTEVPTFDEVERVISIGDNVASSPSWSRSFVALLAENDDALFPAFAGKDLATARPEAELIRLDRGGDSFFALAASGDALRFCDGGGADCLDPDDDRPTLVVVELGVNDMVSIALAMISDPARREDPQSAIDDFQADVRDVIGQVTSGLDQPPMLVATNLVDPSDGVGDIAALVTTFFPFDGAEQVSEELALTVIDGLNGALEEEVRAVGGEVVDVHGAFLGHGYHYSDDGAPHYDAADETHWYQTVIDPNTRGAHEIRRELWDVLAGERIDAIPTDLPNDQTLGLPAVPPEGWANAVVDALVVDELVDEQGTVFPNVAGDTADMLGEPDATGLGGACALGIVGNWAILDLGEGEAATDGEGEDLVVIEFGAQSGGTPEPYRISVSSDPGGPWTVLGDAFGEHAFDLADAGVTRARYVKVESLAQQAEVLGGLGSPYYPGGEFDAVGAVYPGDG